jgi:hypothetical protein
LLRPCLGLVAVLGAACADVAAERPREAPVVDVAIADARGEAAPPAAPSVTRRFGAGTLALHPTAEGDAQLWWTADADAVPQRIGCDRLTGAWGMWTDDVDADGHPEVLITLRKRAKFDPQLENRLHVYGIEDGRCVPAWRGTRLAGRFDALATDPEAPGTIVVSERVGPDRHRVTRYRWQDFGYRVAQVLWQGHAPAPEPLTRDLVVAPS